MDTQRINITELSSDPSNARKHSQRNIEAIASSLRRFGQQKPIVVDKSNVVRAGNGTLEAARHLGWDQIDVVFTNLESSEATAFAIADNRTAELAEWNDDVLAASLQGLDEELQAAAGYEGKELDQILSTLDTADVVEDEVPEVPDDPTTQPGDLWLLGDHRLLCGDSTKQEDVDRLMGGAKAEMMFTDPPYGVNYEGGHHTLTKQKPREKLANDDSAEIYKRFLPVAIQYVDGPCYMWFAGSKALPVYQAVENCKCEVSALLIWHKTNATYAAMNAQYKQRHEPCLYFKRRGSTLRWVGPANASTLWEFERDARNEYHPTQKPVAVACNALKNHNATTVADFFLGSGTTLIAAEQLGRKCYGMELSPQYCDVIVERWQNLTGKEARRDGS